MGLREKVAEVIATAEGRYDHADSDTIANAVMEVVEGEIERRAVLVCTDERHKARVRELEEENTRLRGLEAASRTIRTERARKDQQIIQRGQRIQELEEEKDLLRRQLETAQGDRPGTWDTWAECAARKQAAPPEPAPKPILSLEEARKQAADAARARDIAKEEK